MYSFQISTALLVEVVAAIIAAPIEENETVFFKTLYQ